MERAEGFPGYATTYHFRVDVMPSRPYLRLEWCIAVIENPLRREVQDDGRIQFWGLVEEIGEAYPQFRGKVLKVVTLADGVTIHTAYPDRNFRPR